MNHNKKRTKFVQTWWKLSNNFLRTLTKKRCTAFSARKTGDNLRSIEKIYVINLDDVLLTNSLRESNLEY